MKSLTRTVLLWLVLGGISYLLAKVPIEKMSLPLAIGEILLLPALAVGLTAWATAALPNRALVRVGFWALTSAASLVLIYCADARGFLPLAAGLAALNAALLAAKLRRLPTWRTSLEAASGTVVLALAITAWVMWDNARTRAQLSRAEARWAEIGMPMAEFEKTLTPAHESAGSEVLRQTLRERIGSKFYKDDSLAGVREPAIVTSKAAEDLIAQAVGVLGAKLAPSDDLDLSPSPVTAIEAQAQMLDADYRRLLTAQPPAWACDPHDGYAIAVPNFLGVRKLAQVAAADSLRRISAGDLEGADRAIAAGMRLREGLRENPTLVSLMIDVAVEGLLSTKKVRLPASEDRLQAIAADAASLRTEYVRRLQIEAWNALKMAAGPVPDYEIPHVTQNVLLNASKDSFLQKSVDRILGTPLLRRYLASAALNGADHVVVRKSPATLTLPDLGTQLDDAIFRTNPTPYDPEFTRASMRIEVSLLLQEQVELIRQARAQLAAGQPVESRNSVVLPHLRWELIADAEKNTVATRLVDAPEWIVNDSVTSKEFWVIPIDGSVAWQFRSQSRTAGRTSTTVPSTNETH